MIGTLRSFPPASFFGMPLGILGLGLAWRTAQHLWSLPAVIAELILCAGVGLWAWLALLYAGKWVFARREAIAEFDHAVQCCFIGLAPVTASLSALAVLPYSRHAAIALFVIGAAGTLGFAAFRTGHLWMGERAAASTTPVLYLPTVAGSFVTATAASLMGWREFGQLAFGAGVFSWLALESVILHRLLTGPALPLPLRPTLGIQLAPPAVGALAYLNVGSGEPDIFAQALVGYALLQCLILICLMPWIRAQPFVPAYWSFSFGAAALAGVTVRLAADDGSRLDRALAPLVFVAANLLILALVTQTARLALHGKLLSPPDQSAAARV